MVHTNPTTNVLVAKSNIHKGSLLTDSDFKLEEKPITDVTSDMIKSQSQIENKYATQNIYKGDVINSNRLSDKNGTLPYLASGKVEFSIPLSALNNDTFAGTLRAGDIVELSYTNSKGNTTASNSSTSSSIDTSSDTSDLPSKLKVVGAVDSQGKFLDQGNNSEVAAAIMFTGSQQDFQNISQKISLGMFKIAKCSIQNSDNN